MARESGQGVRHEAGTRLFASQALFSSSAIGVALLDDEGRYVRVNEVLAGWHSSTPDALVAGTPPTTGPALAPIAVEVAGSGEARVDVEIGPVGADGRGQAGQADHSGQSEQADQLWLAGLYPVRDETGQVRVGVLAVDVGGQRRLERARSEAVERLAMVARAGQLMASSLEPAETLQNLGDLLVPALGDHAFVDLRSEGEFVRAAIRHAPGIDVDPALERPVGKVAAYSAGHPIRQVADSGRPWWVHDLTAETSKVPAGPDTDFVRAMGLTSIMVLPVLAAGQLLGTVALACSVSGRHYDTDDVRLAQDVIDRAAISVANSLRFDEQRGVAVALQRSLLPQSLEPVEGLDVAWRYVPGTDGTEVGGDWADVVELPGGRIAVVVGDVMGRGLRAAAVMGQLRTAVRTLAIGDPPPSDLLTQLDTIVNGLGGDQIVTCVYAVYDPGRSTLTVANAGHLPPLLLIGGTTTAIQQGTAVPLGVGGVEFVEHTLDLPDGAIVALYTDGVVERRGGDLGAAVTVLGQALATAGGTLEERCETLLRAAPAAGAAGFTDDVALLLVRAREEVWSGVVTEHLDSTPASVGRARRIVEEALDRWGLDESEDLATTMALLVSELVTNAVRYAPGAGVDLLVRRGPGALWVEVSDVDTRSPRLRHAAPTDEGGRGLALVQALSTGWGSRSTLDGKVVWFRLDLKDPPSTAVRDRRRARADGSG